MELNEGAVLKSLEAIQDPDLGMSIVAAGMVKDLNISDGVVSLRLELTTPACPVKDLFKRQAEEHVGRLPGVKSVNVEMSARVRGKMTTTEGLLPDVAHIILVGAGKGGVGKSTVALNLAISLAQTGAQVGLLDADFYGPSLPMMSGITTPPVSRDGKSLEPLTAFGLKLMSIGFLVEDDQAVIWRGPMIHGALTQLLRDVHWGPLDYLVIDLPPGTGDVPLSLAQQVSGKAHAVLVSTPQRLALSDVVRARHMFEKLSIPVVGIVENMSEFLCPHCNKGTEIFAHGGGRSAAEQLGISFLGEVPIDIALRIAGDTGRPVVVDNPKSASAQAFAAIAGQTAARVSTLTRAANGHVPS